MSIRGKYMEEPVTCMFFLVAFLVANYNEINR